MGNRPQPAAAGPMGSPVPRGPAALTVMARAGPSSPAALSGSCLAVVGDAFNAGARSRSQGGAAPVARSRHRRARSDMQDYYPLDPMEFPLHIAMPEEAEGRDMLIKVVAPQMQGAPSRGALLESPLRLGLTSPAARYRLEKQQQLFKEASAVQLGSSSGLKQQVECAAGAAAAAQVSQGDSAAPDDEESYCQLKHQSVRNAAAVAVHDYKGSMSPRRIARLQEYAQRLAGLEPGPAGAMPPCPSAVPSCLNVGVAADWSSDGHQKRQRQHQQPPPPALLLRRSGLVTRSQESQQPGMMPWHHVLTALSPAADELPQPAGIMLLAGLKGRGLWLPNALQYTSRLLHEKQLMLQPSRSTLGAASCRGSAQQQIGPLKAGRLAALAAARQLRKSSVGESTNVPGTLFNPLMASGIAQTDAAEP
eukprot:gene4778-5029_t